MGVLNTNFKYKPKPCSNFTPEQMESITMELVNGKVVATGTWSNGTKQIVSLHDTTWPASPTNIDIFRQTED